MEADKAQWTRLVAGWESSDLTQREYAQERGITVHALRYWLYRLRKESRPLVASACESSEPVAVPDASKEDLHLVPVRTLGCAPKARRRDEPEPGQLENALERQVGRARLAMSPSSACDRPRVVEQLVSESHLRVALPD